MNARALNAEVDSKVDACPSAGKMFEHAPFSDVDEIRAQRGQGLLLRMQIRLRISVLYRHAAIRADAVEL